VKENKTFQNNDYTSFKSITELFV